MCLTVSVMCNIVYRLLLMLLKYAKFKHLKTSYVISKPYNYVLIPLTSLIRLFIEPPLHTELQFVLL